MSVVLLASSLVYGTTGIGVSEASGAVGVAYFAVEEGWEAVKKAANPDLTCD